MTTSRGEKLDLDRIIRDGENQTVEFKSWIKVNSMKERINLAVDELIAFANSDGGTVYFGIEDTGEITGCDGAYNIQNIIEAIYDKSRPPLFVVPEEYEYDGKKIIALSVKNDGLLHYTADGRCLKRLGKNSKPYYPADGTIYSVNQNTDYSYMVIAESSVADIDHIEVQKLKSRYEIRNQGSSISEIDNIGFLSDLELIRKIDDEIKLTIAGLLFVGKEKSIAKLLPQAEVIYLHYGEDNSEEYDSRIDMRQPIITMLDRLTAIIENENKIQNVQIGLFRLEVVDFAMNVFQEALLNALAHRDYSKTGSIYVRHYPDRIVIDNPGRFPDGITIDNIITHPSVPRNKCIAETLQRLKYVQRTGQGVDIIFKGMLSMGKPFPRYIEYEDAISLTLNSATENLAFVKFVTDEQEKQQIIFSLSELMIMRHLTDSKRVTLSTIQDMTQTTEDVARKNCSRLVKLGLIEVVGKSYMLTARVYEAVKADVDYTRDRVIRYIKAKEMIVEYIHTNGSITNSKIQELCGFSKQQARSTIDKLKAESIIEMNGTGRKTYYILK